MYILSYGFVTCYKGEPIGFICWDPRNRPEYVEIGHNGVRTKFKGKGLGKAQLGEAVRRIKEYNGLKEIRVWTNSNLVAPKNYDSVFWDAAAPGKATEGIREILTFLKENQIRTGVISNILRVETQNLK